MSLRQMLSQQRAKTIIIICCWRLTSVSEIASGVSGIWRAGSSTSSYRKDDYNWRYDGEELPEDVMRASAALENLQLDRNTRNLTSSWSFMTVSCGGVATQARASEAAQDPLQHGGDGFSEDDGVDHM
uniref:Uncharacterized protein n=1 Tax=Chenopodium quinoa TaxID=63459 RepID=A0A803MVR1_CHEQI